MPHDTFAIANYFLDKAKAAGVVMTPMKLQKLVYYAHGWSLGLRGEPLIDEPIQAWPYGPVVRSLYREFKVYGNQGIPVHAGRFEYSEKPNGEIVTDRIEPEINHYEAGGTSTIALLDRIWEVYWPYSAIQLSNMTHLKGTPWRQVCDQHPGGRIPHRTIIPDEMIEAYFAELAGRPAGTS